MMNESDDEEIKGNPDELFKTKNEIIKKPNLELKEEPLQRMQRYGVILNGSEKLVEAGKIISLMKENIIIQSTKPEVVLDLDNILFNEQKEILGSIDDVFGNV